MELSLILSICSFLWVIAITPGPNNMLLTATSANFGFMPAIKLLTGTMIGMQLMLLVVAFNVGNVIRHFPSVQLLFKIAGSCYLLWFSWKIATSPLQKFNTKMALAMPISFWQGGLLQLINPKAWLMVLGAVASFSLAGAQYVNSVIAMSIGMALVNIVAGLLWLCGGVFISTILRGRRAWRVFNLTMGLLTASCVLMIW